jgi:transmembrane protein 126A
MFFFQFIERSIVLRKYDCPLCLQSRAAFLQTGIGFVYPFLLAPMASFMFATRHFTVRLPYVTEQPKEWLKLWLKLTRSAKHLAPYIVLANIIGAVGITSLEYHEFAKLQLHFEEHERKVESGYFDK